MGRKNRLLECGPVELRLAVDSVTETARYVCLLPVNPAQKQTWNEVVAKGTSISAEEQKHHLAPEVRLLSVVMFSLRG